MQEISYERENYFKKMIISIMKITHLEEYTRQFCLVLTHLSQGLASPSSLWNLYGTSLVASF